MIEPRASAAAAICNDRIIVCGGWIDGSTFTNTVECFDPVAGCWTYLPDMPVSLWGHALVSYDNNLILMGGSSEKSRNTVWRIDPRRPNAKWMGLPSMLHISVYLTGIVFDKEIYAIGGRESYALDLCGVDIFDGERWRRGPFLPFQWCRMSSVIVPQSFADRLCFYKP